MPIVLWLWGVVGSEGYTSRLVCILIKYNAVEPAVSSINGLVGLLSCVFRGLCDVIHFDALNA
jgi:hypothetical protein